MVLLQRGAIGIILYLLPVLNPKSYDGGWYVHGRTKIPTTKDWRRQQAKVKDEEEHELEKATF